jgi:trypsin
MGRLRGGTILACAIAALCVLPATTFAEPEPQPKVVGGEATTIEEWPWQVALACEPGSSPQCLSDENGFFRQFCGGSLVAPDVVITAAHCVFDDDPEVLAFEPASDFEVFTGRTTLSSTQGEDIDVLEIYYFVDDGMGQPLLQAQSTDPNVNPELFDPVTLEWDVALLHLESESTSQPIKVAGADETALWDEGRPAYISGWGSIDDGSFPDDLHAAEVEMISDTDCANAYPEPPPPPVDPYFVPETMVCAGFLEGGVDTCGGDSGGPVVVPADLAPDVQGFRLVGDTSWGLGCAFPENPGVYGRLPADPMRTALQSAVQTISGDDIVGSGATVDATAPDTAIDSGPPPKKRNKRATFSFSTDEPPIPVGESFECQLNGKPFEPCSSPHQLTVARRGFHTFRVRARDVSHNFDASPATHTWKVKKKRKRRR